MEELGENNNKVILIFKGIGIAMILSILMIFVLSIILSVTDVKEEVIMPTVIFISSFSILLSSCLVSRKISKKGIMYGSLVGFIYMLILYLISSIINFKFDLNLNSLIMIAFGIFGGAIGGIIGVNLK